MQWLEWSRRIQALAQTGITYTRDPYDMQRYQELRRIAAEIAAAHLAVSTEQVEAVFALEQGYPTPKVDVRAVVFQEGKILLVRETSDGRWSLPGGWADDGETPAEMAVREVREETGYHVHPVKLLAVYDKARHDPRPDIRSVYKLFIRCELTGGQAATSLETSAVEFFARDRLPVLSIGRVTEGQIARMFWHLDNPDAPADFD